MSADSQIAANLYRRRRRSSCRAARPAYGSVFVRRLDQSALVTIHYDTDGLRDAADRPC